MGMGMRISRAGREGWEDEDIQGDDDEWDERMWLLFLIVRVGCVALIEDDRVFYKMVAIVGGRYFSIEHEKYEFQTGIMLEQRLPSAADSLEVQDHCFLHCESVFVSEELCRRQKIHKSAPLRGMCMQ